jgi:hypothetical protein
MRGVITGREVLSNLWVIWREFGTSCVCRCLLACASGSRSTFLEVAVKPELANPPRGP